MSNSKVNFKFNQQLPENFLNDKETFEDFILDNDENDVFYSLKSKQNA